MDFNFKKMVEAKVAQNKQLREEYDREYRVSYVSASSSHTSHKTVFCDSVRVDEGLVRFVDADGNDRWTIAANRVIEYRERQSPTPEPDTNHTKR